MESSSQAWAGNGAGSSAMDIEPAAEHQGRSLTTPRIIVDGMLAGIHR